MLIQSQSRSVDNNNNIAAESVQTNLLIPYLGVGDTEHALYEAILLRGLEDKDIELLHPLGVVSGPVLMTHLLQKRKASKKAYLFMRSPSLL